MFGSRESAGELITNTDVATPSENGDALLLETESSFGAFPFANGQAYVFRREPARSRWSWVSLANPGGGPQNYVGSVFNPNDLSRFALNENLGSFAAEAGGESPTDLAGAPGGPYTTLHEDRPVESKVGGAIAGGADTVIVGASQNLNHVILQSGPPLSGEAELCPGASGVKHGEVLCEWAGAYKEPTPGEPEPELTLVSANEEGNALGPCGARIGNGFYNRAGAAYRAVSADGSRVFLTAPDPAGSGDTFISFEHDPGNESDPGCWNWREEAEGKPPRNAPQLYARDNGEATLELSSPEAGVTVRESERYPTYYAGASEDGSRAFFVTKTELTSEAARLKLHDWELYEWREPAALGAAGPCGESTPGYSPQSNGCITRVSAGEAGTAGNLQGAEILHVPAVSADGSTVYFWARRQLTAGAPATGGIYHYDTRTATIAYVAEGGAWRPSQPKQQALCPENTAEYLGGAEEISEKESLGFSCSLAEWDTTRDGRYLLFDASPGPYSSSGAPGSTHGLYRYDALAAEAGEPALTCVSCGADGAGAGSRSRFNRSAADGIASAPTSAISENGQYVFFDSTEKLVPTASNQTGPDPVLDVYEWHNGTISLIGSGSSPVPTYFLGYSPYYLPDGDRVEGGNVFIGTHARLVPQDTDSLGDVYDARICEPESPCIQPPPQSEGLCEADACAHPATAPNDVTPSSESFSGAGNLTSAPAPPPRNRSAAQIRAERLAHALRACRRDRLRTKRAKCERAARNRYGAAKKSPAARAARGLADGVPDEPRRGTPAASPARRDRRAADARARTRPRPGVRRDPPVDRLRGFTTHQPQPGGQTRRRQLPHPRHQHRLRTV